MKTGALPFQIQVVLKEPCILFDVGSTTVGAGAVGDITVPFVREVSSVQSNIPTTITSVGVCFDTQDLSER